MISIVGWDDLQTDNAPGRVPGAWLIKNSWGAGGYGGGTDWKGDPIIPGYGYIYYTGDPYSDIIPSTMSLESTSTITDAGLKVFIFTRSPLYIDDSGVSYQYVTKGY